MPRDPFAAIKPGEKLPGLPSAAWNPMLDLVKPGANGLPRARGAGTTATDILVKNSTLAFCPRGSVLQVASTIYDPTNQTDDFFDADLMSGTTPAAGSPFVVTRAPLSVGEIGPARLLGLVRVKVNLTDTDHRYCDAGSDPDLLVSATSGPARILDIEDDFTETGDKWAVVNLLGHGAGGAELIYKLTFSTQAPPYTYSSGAVIGTTGLYLICGNISFIDLTPPTNAGAQLQVLGTSSPPVGIIFPYDFLGNVPTGLAGGHVNISATMIVDASMIGSGPTGLDVAVSGTVDTFGNASAVNQGLNIIKLA